MKKTKPNTVKIKPATIGMNSGSGILIKNICSYFFFVFILNLKVKAESGIDRSWIAVATSAPFTPIFSSLNISS